MSYDRVQIELFDPAQGGAVDITPIVERFVLRHSILRHGRTWEIKFADENWNRWTDFLLGNKIFKLRMKFAKADFPETTGWLNLFVDTSESDFSFNRLDGTLRGGDALLKLALKEQRRAFIQSTVDAVFSQIAGEYGFIPDTTQTLGSRTWYQIHTTDYGFLKKLHKYAATPTGRGDVWFWFDNGRLFLNTIDFQQPSVEKYILGGVDDRVLSSPVGFYGGEVDRAGGRQFDAEGYDPLLRKTVSFTAGGAQASAPTLGGFSPKRSSLGLIGITTAETQLPIIQSLARAAWARNGSRYFGVAIETKGSFKAQVGSMVEIDFMQEFPQELAFVRGRYPVFEVEHRYTGELRTYIVGYRREAQRGEEIAVGADASSSRGTDAYLNEIKMGVPDTGPTTTVYASSMT